MDDINNQEPIDSTVTVSVNPNSTEAYVYVTPPAYGGMDITVKDILDALEENHIVYGLRTDIINSIVTNDRYAQKLCVAVATPPIDGENGEITYRYTKKAEVVPIEDENGFVNYKALSMIRIIHEGDVIADIVPPTPGEPGIDVMGKPIRQIAGKKATYSVGLNTKLTEDGLQIVAAVDGHIVFKNGSFNVETVVTILGDVDSAVGNIDFVGDIVVKGSVMEGFKVSSNTNITINGSVNGAILESGGNIIIKKGCINSKITSHGSVFAMFCEHSNIKCDGDLSAQNYVICDIYCGGTLKTKAVNGGIIGGRYIVLNSIEASNIGSKSYIQTDITLGDNALLAEEKNRLLAKITKLQNDLTDLSLIVNFLNEKKKELHRLPEDKEIMLGNAARQKVLYNMEVKTANKRINEINIALENKQILSVSCRGFIYPGTKITINDVTFRVENEYVRSSIGLSQEGKIEVTPL